jgi:hypothetical protein
MPTPMYSKKPGCSGPSCSGCSSPNCMAEGGEVKGVHKDDEHSGKSMAGIFARHAKDKGDVGRISKDQAIKEHKTVLGEMRSMPKPKLQGLAHGGMAKSGSEILSKVEQTQPKPMPEKAKWAAETAKKLPTDKEVSEGFSKQSMMRSKEREADRMKRGGKYAEGGEVSGEMHVEAEPDVDSELHDMMGEELMDAIHSKDSKRIMQSLEACVLSCMNKGQDDDQE